MAYQQKVHSYNQQFLTVDKRTYAMYMEKFGGDFVSKALYDLEGNLVNARRVETRYGWAWAIKNEMYGDDIPTADMPSWVVGIDKHDIK